MIIRINHASAFRDEFHQCGRGEQFSYQALNMLYEFFEDTNFDMELDVIAICCEYSEQHWEDIARAYDIEIDPEAEDEENMGKVIEFLEDASMVVGTVGGSIVYATC